MMQISQNKPMEHFISGFMENYRAKGDKYSGEDPASQFIIKGAAGFIRQTQIVDENEYEIYGRCGQGNWASCPYVDIAYKKFERQGVCIAYILSNHCDKVYLTLNQFVGNKGKRELRKEVEDVLAVLGKDLYGFHMGNEGVDFGSTMPTPNSYKEATILYKKYEAGNVPDESTLCNDLANLMELYRRWIEHYEKAEQANLPADSETLDNVAVADSKIDIELTMRNLKANAVYDTDTNITTILTGSQWAINQQAALPNSAKKLRDEIQKNGVVDASGYFTEDKAIMPTKAGSTSLSVAACVITGGSESGMGRWTLKDGTPIGEYLKGIGVLDEKGNYIPSENRKNLTADAKNGYLRQNVIFYGVPGCGKSHKVNMILNGVDAKYYKRILFHPEYTYSDFVGQLRPVAKDSNITYQFVPGPFTKILCDAYADPGPPYFLIIEEINRGNAPAIFGDLFQLLDRDGRGESEYNIYNEDILDYLKEKNLVRDNIKIPSNLTIFATMNTCDQNVFTLDTAFKRRWRMSRIKNDFSVVSDDRKVSFPQGDISWKEFAEAVNDAILNNCNDGMAAEDKQLGAFFVQQQDCADAERFAQKVLMYLWDDVAKYDKSQLFDTNKYKTLDAVIAGFVKGENVFSPNCTKLNELYEGLISSASSGAGETAQGQPQVARAEDGTGEIPEGQPEA